MPLDVDISIDLYGDTDIEAVDGRHRVFLSFDGKPVFWFPPHTTFGQVKAVRDSIRAALTPPPRPAIAVASDLPAEVA